MQEGRFNTDFFCYLLLPDPLLALDGFDLSILFTNLAVMRENLGKRKSPSRDSNHRWLSEKWERYLCAMPPPEIWWIKNFGGNGIHTQNVSHRPTYLLGFMVGLLLVACTLRDLVAAAIATVQSPAIKPRVCTSNGVATHLLD